jgi:transposase InsO family protein
LVCEVYRIARSSVYAALGGREDAAVILRKRGPRTLWSDEELVQEIRTVLRESPFLGEGHRKARARLRMRGIRVGKNRVLRLMRENGLLAPVRRRHPHGDRTHSGTIRTNRLNELWGTDATRFYTLENGWCWFFGAIDHCSEDIVGWHVAKKGDRWAALEPIRQGVRAHLQGYAPKIALGLGLRHDWAPQYTAHQFAAELRWLGIRSTPAYVGEPECNGIMERFLRTLKEECLYVQTFRTRRKRGGSSERSSRPTTASGSSNGTAIGLRLMSVEPSRCRRRDSRRRPVQETGSDTILSRNKGEVYDVVRY